MILAMISICASCIDRYNVGTTAARVCRRSSPKMAPQYPAGFLALPSQAHRLPLRGAVPPTRCPRMSSARTAVVQIGTGTDLHGQNATTAAIRACRNAIEFNSLPGLARLLPNGDFSEMNVDVQLGVPQPFLDQVDVEKVKQQFPYGQVSVRVEHGGLCCSSGVVLPEQGDPQGDDRAVVVVAAVSVLC